MPKSCLFTIFAWLLSTYTQIRGFSTSKLYWIGVLPPMNQRFKVGDYVYVSQRPVNNLDVKTSSRNYFAREKCCTARVFGARRRRWHGRESSDEAMRAMLHTHLIHGWAWSAGSFGMLHMQLPLDGWPDATLRSVWSRLSHPLLGPAFGARPGRIVVLPGMQTYSLRS